METAFPVSPTEADMSMFSAFLSRAAQAIVDSSTMPKTISDLTLRLEAMQHQLEAKVLHAEQLDQSLSEVRAQREQALAELNGLESQFDWTKADYDRVSRDRDNFKALSEERMVQMKGFFGLAEPIPESKAESPVIVPEPEAPEPEPITEAEPKPAPEPYKSTEDTMKERTKAYW